MNNMREICPLTAIVGKNDKVIAGLQKAGIKCIILENNGDIDYSVRNHADISAFRLNETTFLIDKRQQKVAHKLHELGFNVIFTAKNIAGAYPDDVLLNAVRLGNTLICNKKYISPEILSSAERIIDVKQGYTKCSVCPVSEKAFITDDIGIYKKCKNYFDVLLVEKGDIFLEGKNYGFIGGAGALIDGKLLFFGSVKTHRNSEEILSFLAKHNVSYESLFEGSLIDIGGIIEV